MAAYKLTDELAAALRTTRAEVEAINKKHDADDDVAEYEAGRAMMEHLETRVRFLEKGDPEVWAKLLCASEELEVFVNPEKDPRFCRAVKSMRVKWNEKTDAHPLGTIRAEFTASPNPYFSATAFHREIDAATGETVSLAKITWKEAKSFPSFFDVFEETDLPAAVVKEVFESIWDGYTAPLEMGGRAAN